MVKRHKTSWTRTIDLGRDANGKRIRKTKSFKGNKRRAEDFFRRWEESLRAGDYAPPSSVTVGEVIADYLADTKRRLLPRTVDNYESLMRCHVLKRIGRFEAASITTEQLEDLYAELRERRSARTVVIVHTIVKVAFKRALRQQRVPSNPCDFVVLPRLRKNRRTWLTAEKAAIWLASVQGHRDYWVYHHDLDTGLRRGEILALRWGDVDFKRRLVIISRAVVKFKGEIEFRLKTDGSYRVVPLTVDATMALETHRRFQDERKVRTDGEALVFCNEDGTAIDPSALTHRFAKVGPKGMRFHDLRHSHASILAAQGVHPKIIQERMGHASVRYVMDTYVHTKTLQEEAVAALTQAFSSGSEMAAVSDGKSRDEPSTP